MALTNHGFKTKFGLNLGEETVEEEEEREIKGMELHGLLNL